METPRDALSVIANIREQIEFIEASAEQFDSGRLHFAKMVAVNVRNLVHQTRTSHAMLIQAGVLTEIRCFSGAYNAEEENRRLEEIGSQIRRGEVAYSQSLVGTVIRAEGPPTHQSLFLNPGDWSGGPTSSLGGRNWCSSSTRSNGRGR